MKKVLIILDGLMERYFENNNLKELILGDLHLNYTIDKVDYSIKDKPLDSLHCIMNILGYSSLQVDIGERAFYEAIANNIEIGEDEVVLRCNLIKVKDNILEDFTGGKFDIKLENILANFKIENGRFIRGDKYKNLLVLKKEDNIFNIEFYPPHFNMGKEIKDILPDNKGIINIIKESYNTFKSNDKEGYMLWPWGPSKKIVLHNYKPSFNNNLSAGIISGIDLVVGMGKVIGIKSVKPKGCNGDRDTLLEEKLIVAKDMIRDLEYTIIHVNGFDELAHRKDLQGKLEFIDKCREELIIPLIEYLNENYEYELIITCDHRTDSFSGIHEKGFVPLIKIIN